MTRKWLSVAGALLLIGAVGAEAQYTSDTRIRVQKDVYVSGGDVEWAANLDADIAEARTAREWWRPTGTTCARVDMEEVRHGDVDAELYNASTMISPDSAKIIALCAVPGQIGSLEMENTDGRVEYEVAVIPAGKRTFTKVIIDAQTGAVLSTKQFGGVRGFTGWLRESLEHNRTP